MISQTIASSVNTIHNDLRDVIEFVYKKIGCPFTIPLPELESADYGAYTFSIDEFAIKFRVAKITPAKTGQFVTLWKRKLNGPIEPFDISDPIDLFIICTRSENNFGQFIFPKSVLNEKGILSRNNKGGKRAMRVYPPWDKPTNKQASKTQQWQADYFLEITADGATDLNRAKKLLN